MHGENCSAGNHRWRLLTFCVNNLNSQEGTVGENENVYGTVCTSRYMAKREVRSGHPGAWRNTRSPADITKKKNLNDLQRPSGLLCELFLSFYTVQKEFYFKYSSFVSVYTPGNYTEHSIWHPI